jgi:predicted DNA-binding protein
MKTMAIRLDDEVAEMLGLIANLEGTSQIDQIREAIMAHLSQKMANGELAERAQAALDDIDREASARKAAISTLIGDAAGGKEAAPKGGSRRRGSATKPPEALRIPMGFAPSQR